MKKSDYNSMVIENFIDHYTHNEAERFKMKVIAMHYIEEDHADGEDVPDKENFLFTTTDMRNAFIAGECFESESLGCELGETGETNELDFGDWIKECYNVEV